MSISRILLASALVLSLTSPGIAQSRFAGLAYVPSQGNFNTLNLWAAAEIGDEADYSVQDLARVYVDRTKNICLSDAPGQFVRWYGLVHAVAIAGGFVRVEIRLGENASIVSTLPVDDAIGKELGATAPGTWLSVTGSFAPDGEDCVLQIPPLTAAALKQAQFLASITAVGAVASDIIPQLETIVAGSTWSPPGIKVGNSN